jgi:hypothetical protein
MVAAGEHDDRGVKLVAAAAREPRDRWLERVNAGKYDVSRALQGGAETPAKPMPQLPAA